MSGDLISLRILAVGGSDGDRDLLRRGAGVVTIPLDLIEATTARAASDILARGDVDIAFVDSAMSASDLAVVVTAAHSAEPRAFVILSDASSNEAAGRGTGVDAVVARPKTSDDAQALFTRCCRIGLPSRVLLVDDSSTMRSIVRKILSASRFRFNITEAQEGREALKQIDSGRFDLVILDYNMPGFNGIETLLAIKRRQPRLCVVIMTSTLDTAVAEKARRAGAAAFLKKPFYPSDIDAVLCTIFGLRMPAK